MKRSARFATAVVVAGAIGASVFLRYRETPPPTPEQEQRLNIAAMREAIDRYHADRGAYPASVEMLVASGYLQR